MSEISTKLGVFNSNKDTPHVVWIEPWAEDFTLLPGEQLEIHVTSQSSVPWFNVVESDGHTQVYVETMDVVFSVIQNGIRLDCGHNRQAAIDAGFSM